MTARAVLTACIVCMSLVSYSQQQSSENGHVRAEIRNVMYHFTDSVSVHIVRLEGELVPVGKPGLPVFDDANSFAIEIRSAEISITTEALANALNQYAFKRRSTI